MKIKKIVNTCRREGVARIYDTVEGGVQWLSNGCACYPLYEVPVLSEDAFFTVFDFTPKQRSNTVISRSAFPEFINNNDSTEGELLCEMLTPNIPFGSRLLIPLKTISGIKFLDSEYLVPLADESNDMEIYERISTKGEPYFAVKVGLCLRAIITPFNAINRSFVEDIEKIYSLCRRALSNKEAEEAYQVGAFDDAEA